MPTFCIDQQVILDLVDISISRILEIWIGNKERHGQEINPLTLHTILRQTTEDRMRSVNHIALSKRENPSERYQNQPICGVIFSTVAFHLKIGIEESIDFLAPTCKRSLCSCAEIQISFVVEEMSLGIQCHLRTLDDTFRKMSESVPTLTVTQVYLPINSLKTSETSARRDWDLSDEQGR